MKAIVYTRFGPPDVLQLTEVAKPIPRPNEVLIRIAATTVTAEDPRQRSLSFPGLLWLPSRLVFGFRTPRKPILGFELAGEIEATGRDVRRFQPGDQVYGMTGLGFGAYAEYACLPEDGLLATKPAAMSYEEAAAVPNGALTALVFLRNKGKIQRGEHVLIYGASGSVGTAAVQLAKYFGARVTAVCSGRHAELMRALGADTVIDYTREDFTARGERYDIIFDTVGKTELGRCKRALSQNGRYLLTEFGPRALAQMLWSWLVGGQRVIGAAANFLWRPDDLKLLRVLIEAGQLRAVIDRRYPLEQIAEAHRYVEAGRKQGNVVITVG